MKKLLLLTLTLVSTQVVFGKSAKNPKPLETLSGEQVCPAGYQLAQPTLKEIQTPGENHPGCNPEKMDSAAPLTNQHDLIAQKLLNQEKMLKASALYQSAQLANQPTLAAQSKMTQKLIKTGFPKNPTNTPKEQQASQAIELFAKDLQNELNAITSFGIGNKYSQESISLYSKADLESLTAKIKQFNQDIKNTDLGQIYLCPCLSSDTCETTELKYLK